MSDYIGKQSLISTI